MLQMYFTQPSIGRFPLKHILKVKQRFLIIFNTVLLVGVDICAASKKAHRLIRNKWIHYYLSLFLWVQKICSGMFSHKCDKILFTWNQVNA